MSKRAAFEEYFALIFNALILFALTFLSVLGAGGGIEISTKAAGIAGGIRALSFMADKRGLQKWK